MNQSNKIIVYTDGACSGNPGPGGYAWLLQFDGQEYECVDIAEDTTNNRMELSAVSSVLNFIIEKFKKQDSSEKPTANIYCDSKYICDAINNGWLEYWAHNNWKKKDKTDVKNQDLWMGIYNSLEKINAEFLWVEGHNGNKLNEYCDNLARKASLRNIEPHLSRKDSENQLNEETKFQQNQLDSIQFVFHKNSFVEIKQNNCTIVINKDNLNNFIKNFAEVIIKLNS